jgi:hypothetical protein
MSQTRLPVFVWFAGTYALLVICIFAQDSLALTRCTLVLTAAPAWIFDITDKSSSPAILRIFRISAVLPRFLFLYST